MTASISKPSQSLVLSAIILVQVLFAINYVVSKIVVSHFPPLVWAHIRIVISTLVMGGVALLSGRPRPKLNWTYLGPICLFGLLGVVLNQASFLVGLSLTTSTNSAVLNTLIPVFTLFIVTLRGQEPLTKGRFVGFLFALAGVLVLRRVEDFSLSDHTLIGDLLMIFNCLSYALFLSYSKRFMEQYDPIWTTFFLFAWGSLALGVLALPHWTRFSMPVMTGELWWAAAFAVFGATLITYFLNFWTLRYTRSSQVALFIYLQPVITSAVAWHWMAQPITARTLASTALIFTGMVLAMDGVNWSKLWPWRSGGIS